MTELHVGMRVKVVAPDPNGGSNPYRFTGRFGTIQRPMKHKVRGGYEWQVDIDGEPDNPWPFTSQELAPLDEKPGAMVIEGVVLKNEFHRRVVDAWDSFVGKRVRVTIEVLEDNAS